MLNQTARRAFQGVALDSIRTDVGFEVCHYQQDKQRFEIITVGLSNNRTQCSDCLFLENWSLRRADLKYRTELLRADHCQSVSRSSTLFRPGGCGCGCQS